MSVHDAVRGSPAAFRPASPGDDPEPPGSACSARFEGPAGGRSRRRDVRPPWFPTGIRVRGRRYGPHEELEPVHAKLRHHRPPTSGGLTIHVVSLHPSVRLGGPDPHKGPPTASIGGDVGAPPTVRRTAGPRFARHLARSRPWRPASHTHVELNPPPAPGFETPMGSRPKKAGPWPRSSTPSPSSLHASRPAPRRSRAKGPRGSRRRPVTKFEIKVLHRTLNPRPDGRARLAEPRRRKPAPERPVRSAGRSELERQPLTTCSGSRRRSRNDVQCARPSSTCSARESERTVDMSSRASGRRWLRPNSPTNFQRWGVEEGYDIKSKHVKPGPGESTESLSTRVYLRIDDIVGCRGQPVQPRRTARTRERLTRRPLLPGQRHRRVQDGVTGVGLKRTPGTQGVPAPIFRQQPATGIENDSPRSGPCWHRLRPGPHLPHEPSAGANSTCTIRRKGRGGTLTLAGSELDGNPAAEAGCGRTPTTSPGALMPGRGPGGTTGTSYGPRRGPYGPAPLSPRAESCRPARATRNVFIEVP